MVVLTLDNQKNLCLLWFCHQREGEKQDISPKSLDTVQRRLVYMVVSLVLSRLVSYYGYDAVNQLSAQPDSVIDFLSPAVEVPRGCWTQPVLSSPWVSKFFLFIYLF